jgi:hypothetical protein
MCHTIKQINFTVIINQGRDGGTQEISTMYKNLCYATNLVILRNIITIYPKTAGKTG